MRMRPTTADGDWKPIHNSSQMLRDTEAVAGAVRSRLALIRGEWWEDQTLGFSVPLFLLRGARASTAQPLMGYIAAYVLRTPGVISIASSKYEIKNREMTVDITANSQFGGQIDWSVDLNELLTTLS